MTLKLCIGIDLLATISYIGSKQPVSNSLVDRFYKKKVQTKVFFFA